MVNELTKGSNSAQKRTPRVISVDYWQGSHIHIIELFVRFKTVSRPQGRRFSF